MKLIITLFALAIAGCTLCNDLGWTSGVEVVAAPSASVQEPDADICAGGSDVQIYSSAEEAGIAGASMTVIDVVPTAPSASAGK